MTPFVERISKSISLVTFLILLWGIPETQGHAVWQQTSIQNGVPQSIYTFSEKPGIDNAGPENFGQMVYDKGVQARIQSDNGESIIRVKLDGALLRANIPKKEMYIDENQTEKASYALESFVLWGVFSEHGPAALVQFYTSASHVGKDLKKTLEYSRNELTFLMDLSSETENAVEAYAYFEGKPLMDHTISLYDGDSGELLTDAQTDEKGKATLKIKNSANLLFARVKHSEDEPGTMNGEEYLTTSHIATTFLQVGSGEPSSTSSSSSNSNSASTTSEQEPTPSQASSYTSSTSESSANTTQDMASGYSSVASIAFGSFLGSFFGSFLWGYVQSRRVGSKGVPVAMTIETVDTAIV